MKNEALEIVPLGQVWRYTPSIPALLRQSQMGPSELEASLVYTKSFQSVRAA